MEKIMQFKSSYVGKHSKDYILMENKAVYSLFVWKYDKVVYWVLLLLKLYFRVSNIEYK